MGKITGFMEYKRKAPSQKAPEKRVCDWNEFYGRLSEEEQRIQGARCMECGIPYCHTGIIMNNRVSGCPLNNLIPEFNDLMYKGLWEEALERLLKTNNFPEFTGRVCPAPCEGACTLGINEPAVTIKSNECYIIDKAWEDGLIKPNPPKQRTGKKVAVIGSGPAGLACADSLNKLGHSVTVYEKEDIPGGLLTYGIPNMKLDKSIVKRRIDLMEAEGVAFILNTQIGSTLSSRDIIDSNDATVICIGAQKPRDIKVPGRESSGIYFAMEFLCDSTKALLKGVKPSISAKDKNVVVIGGGDTGTDCVATSVRQGCKSITQIEIMPKPPDEREEGNPWPEWPSVLKTDYGQEEALAVFGKDPRVWLTTAKSFEKDNNGIVKAVKTVSGEWVKNGSGRPEFKPKPETEKTIPAELVLIAAGFLGPTENIIDEMDLETDGRGNIRATKNSYMTNVPGVFSAGDARCGQSLVVTAIDEGRKAAYECDIYLKDEK